MVARIEEYDGMEALAYALPERSFYQVLSCTSRTHKL